MIWFLSLSAKGLTHGEIAAHLAEVYGTEVSKQTISTITDKVMDGMAERRTGCVVPRTSRAGSLSIWRCCWPMAGRRSLIWACYASSALPRGGEAAQRRGRDEPQGRVPLGAQGERVA